MTTTPLPLVDPPHDTVQPPNPRRSEDHEPHLSGGARYAICNRSRPQARNVAGGRSDRARSQQDSLAEGR
jgi:hypothetical protein